MRSPNKMILNINYFKPITSEVKRKKKVNPKLTETKSSPIKTYIQDLNKKLLKSPDIVNPFAEMNSGNITPDNKRSTSPSMRKS